jgi:hypothetical protein
LEVTLGDGWCVNGHQLGNTHGFAFCSKAVLSPYLKKLWVSGAIQGSDKQAANELGDLRYNGPISNGTDLGR